MQYAITNYKPEDVQEILHRIDILDIISEYTILTEKHPGKYYGRCPLHQGAFETLYVDKNTQSFFCYGCGESGDAIYFISKMLTVTPDQALKHLADEIGYPLPPVPEIPKEELYQINEEVFLYFQREWERHPNSAEQQYIRESRQLSEETIKKFGIGSSGNYIGLLRYLKACGHTDEVINKTGLLNSRTTTGIPFTNTTPSGIRS